MHANHVCRVYRPTKHIYICIIFWMAPILGAMPFEEPDEPSELIADLAIVHKAPSNIACSIAACDLIILSNGVWVAEEEDHV